MSSHQIAELRNELNTNIYIDSKTVSLWIKTRWNIDYTPQGVVDLLNRIGFSYKQTKQVFDELKKLEPEITNNFGDTLSWERLDNKKMCRIAYSLQGVNLNHKNDWDKMMEFLIDNMLKLEKSMREPLKKVKRRLNEREETE